MTRAEDPTLTSLKGVYLYVPLKKHDDCLSAIEHDPSTKILSFLGEIFHICLQGIVLVLYSLLNA